MDDGEQWLGYTSRASVSPRPSYKQPDRYFIAGYVPMTIDPIEVAKSAYVHGHIEADELERRIAAALGESGPENV